MHDPQTEIDYADENAFCPTCRTRGYVEFHSYEGASEWAGTCPHCDNVIRRPRVVPHRYQGRRFRDAANAQRRARISAARYDAEAGW